MLEIEYFSSFNSSFAFFTFLFEPTAHSIKLGLFNWAVRYSPDFSFTSPLISRWKTFLCCCWCSLLCFSKTISSKSLWKHINSSISIRLSSLVASFSLRSKRRIGRSFIHHLYSKSTHKEMREIFVSFSSCITIVIVPRSRSEIIKFSTKLFAASSHKFSSDEELLLSAREVPLRIRSAVATVGLQIYLWATVRPQKKSKEKPLKREFLSFFLVSKEYWRVVCMWRDHKKYLHPLPEPYLCF